MKNDTTKAVIKVISELDTGFDLPKKHYKVVDNEFNRAYYSDLIGKVLDTPPGYAAVEEVEEDPTEFNCFLCGALISKEQQEKDERCPTCIADDGWMDPAGGIHYGDDDPLAMYE